MSDETNQDPDGMKKIRVRFDELRNEIVEKLSEFNEQLGKIEHLSDEVHEKQTILDDQLANLSNEEKEWKDIKTKLATTAVDGKVILNVGGDRFTTNVQTLSQERDTFFTALFSKQWKLELDPDDKSIFIDRDGKLFSHILNYLRTNYIPNELMSNESLRQLLIIEAKYFRFHQLIYRLTEPERKMEEERKMIESCFTGGTLLQIEHKKKLNEFYGKAEQKWTLIYKATRDGFGANVFHTNCNNKGPTMSIILSNNNYLFGGYTAVPWTSDGSYENDLTAFLFTLTNPHNIPPTKYLTNGGNAVLHNEGYGPTFGGGHDLHVVDNSHTNGNSYISFPSSYIDTTGKGNNTFTGACNFTPSDIEVYQLS